MSTTWAVFPPRNLLHVGDGVSGYRCCKGSCSKSLPKQLLAITNCKLVNVWNSKFVSNSHRNRTMIVFCETEPFKSRLN